MLTISWMMVTMAVLYVPILFLAAALWRRPAVVPGTARWMAANILIFLGLIGVGQAESNWMYAVADVVLIAASIFSLEGNRQFRGLQPRVSAAYLGGVAAILAIVYFAGVPETRAAAANAFNGMIAALCAATLLKNVPAGSKLGLRFTGGVFAVSAALELGRATYFGFVHAGLTENVIHASSVGLLILLACRSIGWLLLVGERRLMDTQEAETRARSMTEQATAAARARGVYARMMGHEIRNPLSGILATTDLLLETPLAPEQQESIFMLRSAVEALVRMTDDVFELSKLEAGSLTITSAEFDLRGVLGDIAKIFEPTARSKGLKFTIEYAAGMPRRFLGDSGRIRQVIVNLVINALRSTSQGNIAIRAVCDSRDVSKALVRVAVADTGPGIPPQKIAEILERTDAFQGEGGHGIGLVISRRLIELMGGAIEIKSQVGEGSTFQFVLPLSLEQGSNRATAFAQMVSLERA